MQKLHQWVSCCGDIGQTYTHPSRLAAALSKHRPSEAAALREIDEAHSPQASGGLTRGKSPIATSVELSSSGVGGIQQSELPSVSATRTQLHQMQGTSQVPTLETHYTDRIKEAWNRFVNRKHCNWMPKRPLPKPNKQTNKWNLHADLRARAFWSSALTREIPVFKTFEGAFQPP